MKVYIVTMIEDYGESHTIVGVFSTLEKALECKKSYEKFKSLSKRFSNFDFEIEIEEVEVDKE